MNLKGLLRTFFLLTLFSICLAGRLFSQSHTISGHITDKQNRQPLAFVNVILNDGQFGGMSDIDGKYSISATEPIRKVGFSCIGYESFETTLQPGTKKYNIALQPITFELGEVTVEAGENPAHRIIDSVMAHRKRNNPDHLGSYSYTIYDKMVFTVDSTKLSNIKYESAQMQEPQDIFFLDSVLKKNDLMVMETVSEVLFKEPDKKKQTVIANKVAGMKDPVFMYLVSSFQSVSFYEETVSLGGARYVNPISRGSKSSYVFRLENITTMGPDSLFVITFRPREGATFDGLKGVMTVNSDQWAVQNVKASPADQKGMYNIEIQQLYERQEGQWFPKQLNTNLVFPSVAVGIDNQQLPMAAIGKSYLSDIKINPAMDGVRFDDIALEVDPEAASRDEAFWMAHRIDSLNQRTQATYAFLDSLTQGSNLLDRVMHFTTNLLVDSSIPIGFINLDLGRIINLSGQKGWFFGLGVSTNEKLSKWFSINAFGGYWTGLKDFDSGIGIKMKLNPRRQMELAVNFSQTSQAIGEFKGFQERYGTLSEADYRFVYYENKHARQNRAEASFNTRFAQHFKAYLNFSSTHKRYQRQFFHVASDSLTTAQFTEAEIKIRFAYKEKFIATSNGIRSLGTLYPEVWLSYQHSFPGILGSQFEYDRVKFQVSKNFYTKYIGVSKVVLQCGYASETCPVMETFDIMGSNNGIRLYAPCSFNTMYMDEFLCDRFAALFLSHNFSGMLWKTESAWFRPELTIATNIGWGDMRRAAPYPEKNFKTMERGFFESGFVVKGLINVPTVKIGAGLFYRYGPYSFDKVWDNFAWKWSATFSL